MKKFCKVFTVLIFIFLYLPMIVLGVASFNTGTDVATWEGFTLSIKRCFRTTLCFRCWAIPFWLPLWQL